MLSHSNSGDNNVGMTAMRLDFLLNGPEENQFGGALPINAKIPFCFDTSNQGPSICSDCKWKALGLLLHDESLCAQISSYHAEQTAVLLSSRLMQSTVCCNAEAKAECSWTSRPLEDERTPPPHPPTPGTFQHVAQRGQLLTADPL